MRPESDGIFTTPLRHAWRLAATAAFVACAARAAPGSAPAVGTATPLAPNAAAAPASLDAAAAPAAEGQSADGGALVALAASNDGAVAEPDGEATSSLPGLPESACNDQPPQDFLIRGNFLKDPHG